MKRMMLQVNEMFLTDVVVVVVEYDHPYYSMIDEYLPPLSWGIYEYYYY
jgi:hypothetical protein